LSAVVRGREELDVWGSGVCCVLDEVTKVDEKVNVPHCGRHIVEK